MVSIRWDGTDEKEHLKITGITGAPASITVQNMAGKTIVPGFVDPHAHMWQTWETHKNQDWQYMANLACGVTTTHDPQISSTDVFTYTDRIRAGKILGPRV